MPYFLALMAVFILTAYESFIQFNFTVKLVVILAKEAFTNTVKHMPRCSLSYSYFFCQLTR